MQFSSSGDVYLCYIDFLEPDSGGIYVLQSTDGGLSWGNSVSPIDINSDGAKRPIDRPWFTVDRSGGTYDGNQYLTTMPPKWVSPPNRAYFVRSINGGSSWEPWRYLDGTGALIGQGIQAPMPAPVVSSNGTFHAIYPSYVPSQNFLPGFLHASSSDGGASFSYHEAYFALPGTSDSLAKKGYRLASNPADPDNLAFISVANLTGDMDVYLIESTDAGLTWAAPLRLNDDAPGNGVLQDMVWADYDADGDLVVSWRDRRNGGGPGYQQDSEIWGTVRWKDSTNFSSNFRISDTLATYNHAYLSSAGNDFMTVTMNDDTLSAVWGDVRQNRLNIYFQRMALRSLTTSLQQQIVSEPVPDLRIYPNPSADLVTVEGSGMEKIEILALDGRKLGEWPVSETQIQIPTDQIPAGQYFLRIHTQQGVVGKKLQKL